MSSGGPGLWHARCVLQEYAVHCCSCSTFCFVRMLDKEVSNKGMSLSFLHFVSSEDSRQLSSIINIKFFFSLTNREE